MTPVRRTWLRRIARAALALGGVGLTAEAVRVFAGSNRHTVIPGRVYRCSQPSADGLRGIISDHNIRTVINLRGPSLAPAAGWYADELTVGHEAGVSQEDFTLSASLPPPPAELRRLIDVLDHTAYPVLVHCKQGADRTGLVSALTLLLTTDATPAEARRQLWPRYGHISLGKTAAMGRFFDQYESWLVAQNETHNSERFRRWVLTEYRPDVAASTLTWAEPAPVRLAAGQPRVVRLRVENRSAGVWRFEPGDLAGVQLLYSVSAGDGKPIARQRAGLFRRDVNPGETVDFDLLVPPLPAGRYVLTAELLDARGAGVPIRASSFVKMGDEAAQAEVEVR
jgi:protein tyrosine phosphatase (PTP) superfamily phosphohydrolase (DUF442 family)